MGSIVVVVVEVLTECFLCFAGIVLVVVVVVTTGGGVDTKREFGGGLVGVRRESPKIRSSNAWASGCLTIRTEPRFTFDVPATGKV